MLSFLVARFAPWASLLWILLFPLTTTAAPGISCNSLSDRNLPESRECARAAPQTGKVENTPGSIFLGSKCPYPERYRYKLPRSAKSIEFSSWGEEFPIFDDVIDLLDRAESDLESEIKAQSYDPLVRKIRTWTFESAQLVVRNDERGDGVNHRQLMEFLRGLGEFGRVFGFWEARMVFLDAYYSQEKRALGEIKIYTGPRDGA